MSGQPDCVQRYLQVATALIPPGAAREVRAELLAHLQFAALDAELRGIVRLCSGAPDLCDLLTFVTEAGIISGRVGG